MPLTDAQKLQIKKHLGLGPTSDELDTVLPTLEASAAMLDELTTALTAANTAMAAIATAEAASDEIQSGEGAVFNHNANIQRKKAAYRRQVDDLSRILSYPVLTADNSQTTGWLCL